MKTTSKMLAAAVAIVTATAVTVPATAQVAVYTNEALFDFQRPGITSNTFSFPGNSPIYAGQTYTQAAVTFSVPTMESLYELPADDTLKDPHLAVVPSNSASNPTLSISFAGPVLGLQLASYYGAQTISYLVNGTSGTLALPANEGISFIGFDTGSMKGINATFTFAPTTSTKASTLDVVSFQTAVPEAATWAMMMVGLGMVGGSLRRRRPAGTSVSFA